MISSNHLAWPAILSHEFHPVVLPQSSVTSGGFIAHSVELYPVFMQKFQELTWYLVTCYCTKLLHLNSDPQLRKWMKIFHLFVLQFLNFSKLCSALFNTWSLSLSLCPFSFFTYCPLSKCCGCCSFSWATRRLFGGFFPNVWRLNLEALQVRATAADSEKMFGLCIHALMSPEKFGIQQFSMTSEAFLYLLVVKWLFLGHLAWLNETVSAILLCFSYNSNGLCGLSKWKDISMQIYKKSFNIKS